jgi:hypothetical protein
MTRGVKGLVTNVLLVLGAQRRATAIPWRFLYIGTQGYEVVLGAAAAGFLAKREIKAGVFINRLVVFKLRVEEGEVERLNVVAFF